jgi:hypothetical protein
MPVTVEPFVPIPEDLEEVLLNCRYGELEELQQFVTRFGKESLEKARDEDGNGVLHMVCGNGHLGELSSIFLSDRTHSYELLTLTPKRLMLYRTFELSPSTASIFICAFTKHIRKIDTTALGYCQ